MKVLHADTKYSLMTHGIFSASLNDSRDKEQKFFLRDSSNDMAERIPGFIHDYLQNCTV